jgi:hypothetical protein
MRWLFFALIVGHGLVHAMGFAKAFSFAELPQLTVPISRRMGLLWLTAGLAHLVAGVLLIDAPRVWWAVGLVAVLLSQFVVMSAWDDAKFATLVNLVVLAGVVYGFAAQGPFSLRAEYEREVGQRTVDRVAPELVAESDLAPLPDAVQRYLRVVGAVGQPKIHDVRARWTGRIRSGPDDPWMPFTAQQHNFLGEPSRFFLMDARRSGLPVAVYHAFQDDSASMRVRLLSMLPVAHASGPEFTRAETVTLFNDLVLLAPAALIDADVRWEPLGDGEARGHFTAGSHTVSAVLSFNQAGELVDFVSDDRLAASPDGTELIPQGWSTPVGRYRDFGARRAATRGEGRWHPVEGDFAYIELELVELEYNGGP